MVISTLASTRKENQRVRASTSGKMALSTLESFRMGSNTAKANGRVEKGLNVTSTKEITHSTKNMAMASFSGPRETFTKVSTKKMNAMGMER